MFSSFHLFFLLGLSFLLALEDTFPKATHCAFPSHFCSHRYFHHCSHTGPSGPPHSLTQSSDEHFLWASSVSTNKGRSAPSSLSLGAYRSRTSLGPAYTVSGRPPGALFPSEAGHPPLPGILHSKGQPALTHIFASLPG